MNPNYKKALFQKELKNGKAQCLTCERRCIINNGKLGFCQTRENVNGEIYSIVYGVLPAISINPIEKKPFYHFYPGSKALTVGTYGCNFSCFWCQNDHLSHPKTPIRELIEITKFTSPQNFIKLALKNNVEGTSISFNEPTLLLEYSLEVFREAKRRNLYNTFVSNGYMTGRVLDSLIKAGLDAINIDIKGSSKMVNQYCGANMEKVWKNAVRAKKLGVHLELTTLLIGNLNSDRSSILKISNRIRKYLGPDVPFHISRFFPHYLSNEHGLNIATPLNILYDAYKIAKSIGLNHVYLGNVSSNSHKNTYCPNCNKTLIERTEFSIRYVGIKASTKCKNCGLNLSKFLKI